MYKPPFEITKNMLKLSISITEKIGKITAFNSLKRMPILRKNNKIKSIHSSLAIEANSLSINQVRDIIEGKLVIGPQKEIQEVKNAYKVYSMLNQFDCYSESDLLKAHGIMTELVDNEAGKYRNHAEGVFDGNKVIFIASPEKLVPSLMSQLFEWLKKDNETHTIIKSCVFHYEFVFIHPFGDGNGRIARLWQNVILSKWNPIFEYIPLESQIQKYQSMYYDKIAECHKNGNSNEFIEFMLNMIDKTLDEVATSVEKESKNISDQMNRLLEIMEVGIPYSANDLMIMLGIKTKETLRKSYLNPAIENHFVVMSLEDKPNSKNQRYIKL